MPHLLLYILDRSALLVRLFLELRLREVNNLLVRRFLRFRFLRKRGLGSRFFGSLTDFARSLGGRPAFSRSYLIATIRIPLNFEMDFGKIRNCRARPGLKSTVP